MKKAYKYSKRDIYDALYFIFETINENDINLAIYHILTENSLYKGIDITVETLLHKSDYDYEAKYDIWHQIVDQCDWENNNWYDEDFKTKYDYDLTANGIKEYIEKNDVSLSKKFIKDLHEMWDENLLKDITEILKEDNLL